MSVAWLGGIGRLGSPLNPRVLIVGLVAVGVLLLVPVRPSPALESKAFGDLRVPRDAGYAEAYTVVGDVTVRGEVYGDVRCAFGDVTVRGPVEGDVQTGFGDVYVNAPVGGSVEVGRGAVRLGPRARVGEDLSLGNGSRPMTHPAAVVAGEQRYGMASGGPPLVNGGAALANLTLWLFATLGLCAAAMLCAVLARRPLGASARCLRRYPVRSMLLGVISAPAAILFSLLLAVTVVGAPLLLLSTPAYLALLVFGLLVSAYHLGRRILLLTGSHRGGEAFAAAVGAFVVSAVYLVPVVGGVLLLGLSLLGVGAAISALLERLDVPGASNAGVNSGRREASQRDEPPPYGP